MKENDEDELIDIDIPEDLLNRIAEAAEKENVSIQQYIEKALIDEIQRMEALEGIDTSDIPEIDFNKPSLRGLYKKSKIDLLNLSPHEYMRMFFHLHSPEGRKEIQAIYTQKPWIGPAPDFWIDEGKLYGYDIFKALSHSLDVQPFEKEHIMSNVMKETRGKANPMQIKKILEDMNWEVFK